MRYKYLLLLLLISFSACRKSEIDQVASNEPPPDNTISIVTIDNYIYRTYILTLGRDPDSIEFNSAKSLLNVSKLDSTSRQIFLNTVFNSADYRPHVYEENRLLFLDNTDTSEFTNWITIYQIFLADTSYHAQWPSLQYELSRLISARNAFSDFVNEIIKIDELQRRLCNINIYDMLHAGSLNFVVATFQELINRNATSSEQQSGVSMVDGNNAVLFLQSGSSKIDYLNIITHSNSYFEGQVLMMYKKYLNRDPNTVEMANGTLKYSSTGDYTAVQRDILSSDEFIGH